MAYSASTLAIRRKQKTVCACGCGEVISAFTPSGANRVSFKWKHQTRVRSPKQKEHSRALALRNKVWTWNRGRTYVFSSKVVYKTKATWSDALKKCFPDACAICEWNGAPCDCHHITPRSKGGKHTLVNGIILCPNHHRMAHSGKISAETLTAARAKMAPRVTVV